MASTKRQRSSVNIFYDKINCINICFVYFFIYNNGVVYIYYRDIWWLKLFIICFIEAIREGILYLLWWCLGCIF